MEKGYIYIMTNPCLKGMVKIGYAKDVEVRRKQLSTTALPYDYEIYAMYETPGNLEDKKLHNLIDGLNDGLRVTRNREFYEMSPEDAYDLLAAIAAISGTQDKLRKVKQSVADDQQKSKRPAVNFLKCNIPIGAELVFVDDPSIRVIVENERKVLYRGMLTSLSAIAKDIKGYSVAGPALFTYNGKLVSEIARDTQWKDM